MLVSNSKFKEITVLNTKPNEACVQWDQGPWRPVYDGLFSHTLYTQLYPQPNITLNTHNDDTHH